MKSVNELVDELDTLSNLDLNVSSESFENWLQERQQILSAIQNTDTKTLEPSVRQGIKARLREIQKRDEIRIETAHNEQRKIAEELEKIKTSRTAVKTYHTVEVPTGYVLDRKA